jgi:hypothetical protein
MRLCLEAEFENAVAAVVAVAGDEDVESADDDDATVDCDVDDGRKCLLNKLRIQRKRKKVRVSREVVEEGKRSEGAVEKLK